MEQIKPKYLSYFTQIQDISDEERIYVSAFFGNVDITLWREATESEKEEHRLRMESKEII